MFNGLLEILGRGMTVDMAELLTGWLNEYGYTLADQDEASYKIWLGEVVEDLLHQRLEAADHRVRLILASNPDSVAGHLALAAVSFHQEAVAQAQNSLERICHTRPDHTLALYALGHCCERLGDDARAVACYQDCLKFQSFLSLPLQRLAAIHVKNLQYESAYENSLSLRQIDPEAMSTHVILGSLALATGQSLQAVQSFENAILMNPDALFCQDPQIEQLVKEDLPEKALQRIEFLLEESPQKPDLLAQRADLLVYIGAHEEAISEYHQALRECPTYLEAAVKLARLYSTQEVYDQSARTFLLALEINDQIIDAYVGLASSYHQAGRHQNSFAALCSASMLQSHACFLLSQAARMLLKHVDPYLEALDSPQELTSLLLRSCENRLFTYPRDPISHYSMGLMAFYAQGSSASLPYFSQAVGLHPFYPRATTKLILSYYASGDNHHAIKYLNTQNDLTDPSLMQLYYKTALLFSSRTRFAASMLNLSRHLHTNMAEVDPSAHIRIVLQNVGVLDRAEVMYDWLHDTLTMCLTAQDQA